jgi:serine/threonine-protein kinase
VLDVSTSPVNEPWLGKYRLIAQLGHGGMADVYLGLTDERKLLVLKRLRNVEDQDATAMFLDEARIAVRLQHPNVVRTFEVAWENEAFFIVMEFLHGPTFHQLRRRAAATGGLPLRFELYILSQALRGLQYAHDLTDVYGAPLRIVHRDFTPQNIIITHFGVPKVLDFGIAKAADSAVQTQAGMYKGKLSYMPPEQLAGKRVDARADVFAVGAMLFQTITGKGMWEGADSTAIMRQLIVGNIPPIRGVKAGPGAD